VRFDEKEMLLTHEEALKWVEWFLLEQTRRGLPKDQKDHAGFIIMAFLESGPTFIATNGGGFVNCPKCQGRGHSNLFKLGEAKPSPCENCKGTGSIVTGKMEGLEAPHD
jgi:hypothetical protein